MAAVQVQKKSNTSATTSVAVGATQGWAAPVAGNILIAAVYAQATSPASVSGFTSIINDPLNATNADVALWWKVADGTETTVTATHASATQMDLHVFEYSGLAASPVDKSANEGSNSSTTTTSRATGTTNPLSQPDELVLAAVGTGSTTGSLSWNNSFAIEMNTAHLHTGSLNAAATAGKQSTASWVTLRTAGGCIATFKVAKAAPFPTPRIRRNLMRS